MCVSKSRYSGNLFGTCFYFKLSLSGSLLQYFSYGLLYFTILAKFQASLNLYVEYGKNILGIPLAQGAPIGIAREVIMYNLMQPCK